MKIRHVFLYNVNLNTVPNSRLFITIMFQKKSKTLLALICLMSVCNFCAQAQETDTVVPVKKTTKSTVIKKPIKVDTTKKATVTNKQVTSVRSKVDTAKKTGTTKSPISPKKNTSSKVDTLKKGTLNQKPNTSVLKKVMDKQDTTKKTASPKAPIKGKSATAVKLDTTKKSETAVKGKPKSGVKPKLDSLKKEIPIQKTTFDILSPDKKISVNFKISRKKAWYSVKLNKETVLDSSKLGMIRDDDDYTTNFTIISASAVVPVSSKYEMLNAKRKANIYKANKQIFHLQNGSGHKLDVIFQVSNDGLAFKYFFPDSSKGLVKIENEITSFNFPAIPRLGYNQCQF